MATVPMPLPLAFGGASLFLVLLFIAVFVLPPIWGFACGYVRRKKTGLLLAFIPFIVLLAVYAYEAVYSPWGYNPRVFLDWVGWTPFFLFIPLGACLLSQFIFGRLRKRSIDRELF